MRKVLSRRLTLASGVVGAVGIAVAFATAGTAQADSIGPTPNAITICENYGDTITVFFIDRPNNYSVTPPPAPNDGRAQCTVFWVGGDTDEDIKATDNPVGDTEYTVFNGTRGLVVPEF
ncbi:MAG TPA: hypothetical protein VHX38_26705 [Pseudonocardiaceae bacterium]|jgi:hypothetical protein|nr:hypothetical protein [Pseudonocardiaceae bacterium]